MAPFSEASFIERRMTRLRLKAMSYPNVRVARFQGEWLPEPEIDVNAVLAAANPIRRDEID